MVGLRPTTMTQTHSHIPRAATPRGIINILYMSADSTHKKSCYFALLSIIM